MILRLLKEKCFIGLESFKKKIVSSCIFMYFEFFLKNQTQTVDSSYVLPAYVFNDIKIPLTTSLNSCMQLHVNKITELRNTYFLVSVIKFFNVLCTISQILL